MRFNIFFCLSSLALLSSFSLVSARPIGPRDESELAIRSGDELGLGASYDALFRRAQPRVKSTAAAANLRKANVRAEANKNGKGSGPGPINSPKHQRTQVAANNKIAQRKQDGRAKYGPAAAAQANTLHKPARGAQFRVPHGPTYSGKEVRKALFGSHMARQGHGNVADLKHFGNKRQIPARPRDEKPLNAMAGKGNKFPIYHANGRKGNARVITQSAPGGGTRFMGVVAPARVNSTARVYGQVVPKPKRSRNAYEGLRQLMV